jgi:hypothetical protein
MFAKSTGSDAGRTCTRLALGLEICGKFSKGKIMKKLALFSMLLGLGLFTIGCGETKPKTNPPVAPPADTTTDGEKPADEGAPADEMPAEEGAAGEDKPAADEPAGEDKPAADEPAGEEKPADEKPADEKAPE